MSRGVVLGTVEFEFGTPPRRTQHWAVTIVQKHRDLASPSMPESGQLETVELATEIPGKQSFARTPRSGGGGGTSAARRSSSSSGVRHTGAGAPFRGVVDARKMIPPAADHHRLMINPEPSSWPHMALQTRPPLQTRMPLDEAGV